MSAYSVVEEFEHAIGAYTGAPYVVCTNSCSMALLIALSYFRRSKVMVPKRTYCSVPNSVALAGHRVSFRELAWEGEYRLEPLPVWDSARRFTCGMYRKEQMQCVSFQSSKILGIEQGGAILLDDWKANVWLRRARFDGRLDASEKLPQQRGWHCYMNPSTAALGLARMTSLPKHNPDQVVEFEDLSVLGLW